MEGTVAFRVDSGAATLEVDRIVNNGDTTTGTLYLTLWMTAGEDPYVTGHRAARVSLAELDGVGRLAPGYQYEDVRLATGYFAPLPGTYYVHLFVSEYPDLDTTLDLITFTDTVTVSNAIEMDGTAAFRVDGDTATLEVERIVNNRDTSTGTLHLTLWMTEGADPYTTGHQAARVSLAEWDGVGRLEPGYRYEGVRLATDYYAPPPGTYYVHLYVSEHPDLDAALDLITFTDTVTLADDHADTPADATVVSAPSDTAGLLDHGGDVDVFRIDLGSAGTLRVRTTGATDTHGTLKDADAVNVAIDDDSGERLNFAIEADVQPASWYVEVRGFDRTTTGRYTLSVMFDPAPEAPTDSSELATRHLGDFDGDGRDDMLLRHIDGRWYYYPMNGRRFVAGRQGAARLTTDLDYRVAGIGDFNGDGRDDVLLRHVDGGWYYYPMNGRSVAAGEGVANLTRNLAYSVGGIGDFNGDGRDDVLLRHRDGRWRYYPMDGRSASAGRGSANLTRNLDYGVVGIGDFNGDGRDGVLLRHRNGRWYYYPMNGRWVSANRGSVGLTRNLDYRMAGVGDLDGDGRDDVLLRHSDGRWYYYPMNGRTVSAGRGSANLTKDVDYRIAGVGDLDGDGRDDVLLRHVDGRWYYYPMDGRYFVSGRGSANLTRNLDWAVPGRGGSPNVAQFVMSGTLAVTAGQVLDGDTNDPNDPVTDNAAGAPQSIPLPVAVAGYADETNDSTDVYRVYFPAPVRLSLAIADADAADLDLYLADSDGEIVELSAGIDNLEIIQTTRTGEHLVLVEAYSGSGNYSLVSSIVETANGALQPAVRQTWSRDGEFVPDELIATPVRLSPADADLPREAVETVQGLGFTDGHPLPAGHVLWRSGRGLNRDQGRLGFRFASDEVRTRAATLIARKRLRASGAFEHVQPNYIYRSMAVPDDSYYELQWHYPHINLPQAWDLTTGDDSVVTAVIDTGVVTDHPDLQARLLPGYDFISDPYMAADGDGIDPDAYDTGDRQVIGQSSSFHGTHVAGTIGAATDNGMGVAGVTWRGRIMPIRVLGVGGGTDVDIAEGILYAAGVPNASGEMPPRRADIINLSLGPSNEHCLPLPDIDRVTSDALTAAIAAGVTVVVAAGNDGCHVPTPMSTVDGVISVGAVDHFRRAPYSNFGSTVDVVAPGGNVSVDDNGDAYADGVWSVLADDTESSVAHTYQFRQGTSMAAPHVAGVIGLMLAANPDLTPSDINRLLDGTHSDAAAAPITRDWGLPGRDDEFGHGLIDAYQAVRVAQAIQGGSTGPADRPVLAVSPTRLHFGATANVLRVRLSNAGTGPLTVHAVTVDQGWLDVSFDEWPTLVVAVDRDGLEERTHLGHISVESDGGDLSVPVTIQVQREVVEADIGTVYVLALDPEDYETAASAATNVRAGYAFEMPGLPPGEYIVAAGTDRNDDGYICDAGEACGIWPLLDSPATVDLDGDQDIDFGVSIDLFARVTSQSVESTKVGERGFRIRPTAVD